MDLTKYLIKLNLWFDTIDADKSIGHIHILKKLEKELSLSFLPDSGREGNVCMANSNEIREDYKQTLNRLDLLDYLYAILHSPGYRKNFDDLLKVDFARVPSPKDPESFWKLVTLGGELRHWHLLNSVKVKKCSTRFPVEGTNAITTGIGKKDWQVFDLENKLGRIWINDRQYFENIPEKVWKLNIDGYRPAQKWLTDRRGHILHYKDIEHYQKIIATLNETIRLIQEIAEIEIV